jgi:hypothetical protein
MLQHANNLQPPICIFKKENTLSEKPCQSSILSKEKLSFRMENVGRPCGDDGFVGRIEGLLNRELKARGKGRPIKDLKKSLSLFYFQSVHF